MGEGYIIQPTAQPIKLIAPTSHLVSSTDLQLGLVGKPHIQKIWVYPSIYFSTSHFFASMILASNYDVANSIGTLSPAY